MSRERDEYPITNLHIFLDEASREFKRFRLQAKITLIGSIVILLLISRFLIYALVDFGPAPFGDVSSPLPPPRPDIPDLILLLVSFTAVLFTIDVWFKQRRFVSRWGERFGKLDALEKRLLADDTPMDH